MQARSHPLKFYEYLLLDGEEDLDRVGLSASQILLPHVHSLSFYYLLLAVVHSLVWTEASIVTVSRVATFFEKWLVTIGCTVFLLNNEIRRPAHVCLTCLPTPDTSLISFLEELVRVLADVMQQLSSFQVLLSPSRYVVVWLFFLKTFQNDLVLTRDLHKLSLSRLSVETLFELNSIGAWYTRHSHLLRLLIIDGVGNRTYVCVGMRDALGVLQDICHLFKKNSVFAFDLSVSLYMQAQVRG